MFAPSVTAPSRRPRLVALIAALLAIAAMLPAAAVAKPAAPGTYQNPLQPQTEIGTGIVESCADPSAIYGKEGEKKWFMYCTADPLNDEDRDAEGDFIFRPIPILQSTDLVNWTYVGDAFTDKPAYARADAGLWAPEIQYYEETGRYHLYYTVTETTLPGGGSAIGVATSDNPWGPFVHSAAPAIEPHGADCCGPGSRRHVFDPEVERTDGLDYIYYGSYFGGVSVRVLSEDGLTSTPIDDGHPATGTTNVAIANKYEGSEVEKRGKWWYIFLSATDCCRGPATGYAVFVGRSLSPTGPFLDRSGVDLNDNEPFRDPPPDGPENHTDPSDARAGGTPFLYGNGNRWIGTGHNHVFTDFGRQWWTLYHALDRNDPYFEGGVDLFDGNCSVEGRPDSDQPCGDLGKRPVLLDAIDWTADGWPTVNGGRGPSDEPQPAPAAQPGQRSAHQASFVGPHQPGAQITALSDEFNDATLSSQWSWVRGPAAGSNESGGSLRIPTQAADLFVNSNNASVLLEQAPSGDFMVESRVRVSWPSEGCCHNFIQAGLVLYEDDDNFVKLTPVSIWNTRQTEWAKEVAPVPDGFPRYGNSVVGPPGGPALPAPDTTTPLGEWTTLRIVREAVNGEEHYTAYTRADNGVWEQGMTWTHELGSNARIGLVSMGGGGREGWFDYVRVYELAD